MGALVLVGGVDGAALLAGADLLVAVSDTGIAFAAGRGSPVTAARLPFPDSAGASSARPDRGTDPRPQSGLALSILDRDDELWRNNIYCHDATTAVLEKIKPLSTASFNAIVS